MKLVAITRQSGLSVPTPIAQGDWSVCFTKEEAMRDCAELVLRDCALGGAPVLVEPRRVPIAALKAGALVVRAREVSAPTLRVVAADTGTPLQDVEVVRCPAPAEWVCPPSSHWPRRVVEHAPSVVPLPWFCDDEPTVYWVRASGHAWRCIEMSDADAGEHVVLLERAGLLRLVTRGALPAPPARVALRLYRCEDHDRRSPCAELLLDLTGVAMLELPPGAYAARLELGEREGKIILGAGDVLLRAGCLEELTLAVAPTVRAPPLVRLAVTLVIPAAWRCEGARAPRMLLTPVGETQRWTSLKWGALAEPAPWVTPRDVVRALWRGRRQVTREQRFTFGLVPAGSYELAVDPVQVCRSVTVAEPGCDLRIEVGPPAEIEVHCFDADSGTPMPGLGVRWSPAVSDVCCSSGDASAAPGSSVISVLAAPGRIVISPSWDRFWFADRTLDARPGKQEVHVRVTPACGVRIRPFDGCTHLTVGPDWSVRLDPAEGIASEGSFCSCNGESLVERPGRYRLLVDPPVRYARVPAQDVELRRGEVLDVEVRVWPKQ